MVDGSLTQFLDHEQKPFISLVQAGRGDLRQHGRFLKDFLSRFRITHAPARSDEEVPNMAVLAVRYLIEVPTFDGYHSHVLVTDHDRRDMRYRYQVLEQTPSSELALLVWRDNQIVYGGRAADFHPDQLAEKL